MGDQPRLTADLLGRLARTSSATVEDKCLVHDCTTIFYRIAARKNPVAIRRLSLTTTSDTRSFDPQKCLIMRDVLEKEVSDETLHPVEYCKGILCRELEQKVLWQMMSEVDSAGTRDETLKSTAVYKLFRVGIWHLSFVIVHNMAKFKNNPRGKAFDLCLFDGVWDIDNEDESGVAENLFQEAYRYLRSQDKFLSFFQRMTDSIQRLVKHSEDDKPVDLPEDEQDAAALSALQTGLGSLYRETLSMIRQALDEVQDLAIRWKESHDKEQAERPRKRRRTTTKRT